VLRCCVRLRPWCWWRRPVVLQGPCRSRRIDGVASHRLSSSRRKTPRESGDGCVHPHGEKVVGDDGSQRHRKPPAQAGPCDTAPKECRAEKKGVRGLDNSGNIEGRPPISRRLSRGNTLPYTTFDHFFPWRAAWPTPPPTCGRRRLPVCLRLVSTVRASPPPPSRRQASGRLAGPPHVSPEPLSCPSKPSGPCRVQAATPHTGPGALAGPVAIGLPAEAAPAPII